MMPGGLDHLAERGRARFWWPFVLILAAAVYIYHFDGLYIPRIGDESPYIQIVRLTAQSGRWLPLQTASGLEDTKPPLLFWLGILSTDWAREWTLWRLRFPIVGITFLTAVVVFWLARRLSGSRACGYIAALTFLGFRSTFQYGRPFLTNLPETFFVFLPFAIYIGLHDRIGRWNMRFWIPAGLSLGVACLFKSFVLVVPAGFAFTWIVLVDRGWNVSAFFKKDAVKIAVAVFLALFCFALWPIMDPDPGSVLRNFVVEENVGKLGGPGYLTGLFRGPYTVYRIWLAPLASAGLFALPLAYASLGALGRRREMLFAERALWLYILSFLIVYTLPSQRQENYLLPVMPAAAVLIAHRWERIPGGWLRVFYLPILLALALLYGLMFAVSEQVLGGDGYPMWQLVVPGLALAVSAVGFLVRRTAPFTLHLSVLLATLALTCFLAPFDGGAGRFEPERVGRLRGKTIYVPSNFIAKYERHRFLLPGARIEGYDPDNVEELNTLLRSRKYVAVHRALGQALSGPYRIFATRFDLRTRQTWDEMRRIAIGKELDLFIRREVIVRRRAAERERSDAVKR